MDAGGSVWALNLWILKVLMRRVDLEWFWSGKSMSKVRFLKFLIKVWRLAAYAKRLDPPPPARVEGVF